MLLFEAANSPCLYYLYSGGLSYSTMCPPVQHPSPTARKNNPENGSRIPVSCTKKIENIV